MGKSRDILTYAHQLCGPLDPRLEAVAERIDGDARLTALLSEAEACEAEAFPGLAYLRETLGPLHMGFFVFLVLQKLPQTRSFYRAKGISTEIMYATLTDISRNMEEYERLSGQFGIGGERYPWLYHHVEGRLFQLGRLQFMMHRMKTDTAFGEIVVHAGAKLLETHIPAGVPLTPEICSRSYQLAMSFFEKTFDFVAEGFLCESWLLSPELREILPAQSNISRFAEEYHCTAEPERDLSFIQYVYGMQEADAGRLPEGSVLQRSLKQFLLDGGVFHAGFGVRPA